MRTCPRCRVTMSEDRRTFATLDVCPQCHGLFVDPGETITALKHGGELQDLVDQGKAEMVAPSLLACPASHGMMTVYRVADAGTTLEIDVCPTCLGIFFDAGEESLLAAVATRAEEMVTASGARFSAPPRASLHDAVVAEKSETGRSAFAVFFEAMAQGALHAVGRSALHRHRHHRHRR